jgi:hypothetical protein
MVSTKTNGSEETARNVVPVGTGLGVLQQQVQLRPDHHRLLQALQFENLLSKHNYHVVKAVVFWD